MSHKTGYIYDLEHNEYYIPEQHQCDLCFNEAEVDGLCRACQEEIENEKNNFINC